MMQTLLLTLKFSLSDTPCATSERDRAWPEGYADKLVVWQMTDGAQPGGSRDIERQSDAHWTHALYKDTIEPL